MIFEQLAISGVWRVSLEPKRDQRGWFARTFCGDEFAVHKLPDKFDQCSLSRNFQAGTLRGMHYQRQPHSEEKFVRCVRGSIFDVVVDLRPDSTTRGEWLGEYLDADKGNALYIPKGLAHGFQTLEANTDVLYHITPAYQPGFAEGVRWNDPAFSIEWPMPVTIVSERDAAYPDWVP